MCDIIQEMSLHWIIGVIIGFLVLRSGVTTAGNVTEAPGVAKTTSDEISAFIISIKITNRIYDNSLEDNESQSYKILRQDVENVFFETYSSTPSAQYQEIAEMNFSNGSVIANSIVLFGTKQKSGQAVKNIFVTNYQQHTSPTLDLHINYTADHEPIPVPLSLLQDNPNSLSSITASITSPDSHTPTELSDHDQSGRSTTSTTSALTAGGPDESLDVINVTSATPQTHSPTKASDFTHAASQTTSDITSNKSGMTEHPSTITSTMSTSSPSTMTEHPHNISTMSASRPSTMTEHPHSISTMSASRPSTMTEHPHSISTMSASTSSTMTEHPHSISTMSASTSSTKTEHPHNISTMSASTSSTKTEHPHNISTMSASTKTEHPHNISTMSASTSSTKTEHPHNSSAMSASSSSVIPGKPVTQKPTGPEGSDTTGTEQGVPGWGIAILVLAAIILFFMLVLLILLLLFWCCWWRQRGFMSVSDPDPTGYYNPDIPMYSTHSTYESHNGKSLSDNENLYILAKNDEETETKRFYILNTSSDDDYE